MPRARSNSKTIVSIRSIDITSVDVDVLFLLCLPLAIFATPLSFSPVWG